MSERREIGRGSFETPSFEDWVSQAERDLAGVPLAKLRCRTLDGIEIEPLYTARDAGTDRSGDAGSGTYVRGRRALGLIGGWTISQEVASREPAGASEAAALLVRRGAEGVTFLLDPALRAGNPDEAAGAGVAVRTLEDFSRMLESLDLGETSIAFEAGCAAPFLAPALTLAARARGTLPADVRVDIGYDPLATLAELGSLPHSEERAWSLGAELVAYCDEHLPAATPLAISTMPYAHAGAGPALELGLGIAAGIETLRQLESAGLAPGDTASALVLRCAIGRDLFAEIAKLRAARRLWARVLEACSVAPERRGLRIHARSSRATKSARDAWVNLLRTTIETFAGAVGGAETITVSTFDEALGAPDEFGLRLAPQAQCVLREESHLSRVVDPAGGSWYVESLTSEIASTAWAHVRHFESRGGFLSALREGEVARLIDEAAETMREAVAQRREAITGVSSYPDVHEKPVIRPAPGAVPAGGVETLEGEPSLAECEAALRAGASLLALFGRRGERISPSVTPLPLRRLAAPFEELRDACDAHAAREGGRPAVFLANMGAIPQHRARAMFAKNLVEAGGLEALPSEGYASPEAACGAFAESPARIALICSSDETYPELVPALARGFKQSGALRVLVAGRAGEHEDAWRAAGVDAFVYVGCDVVSVLRDLLEALEVIR